MTKGNKINLFQFALLLIHTKIGIGVITLANDVHHDAHSDGWISTLLAGLFIQLIIFIYWALIHRFPNQTLSEIAEMTLGKIIGKLVMILYIVYLIIVGAIMLTKYTVILKSWMMPLTPKWVLVSFMGVIGIYLGKENLHIISRFFMLASFVLLVFMGINIYALKDVNFTYILPIGSTGFTGILKGMFTSMASFQGFEYILIFAPFVLASPRQVIKAATLTNVFVTLFYTLSILTIELYFSAEELKLIIEPIFYIVKSYTFTIIERPDLLFTSLWLLVVITSVIALFYVTSLGLHHVFQTEERTIFVYIVAIISFVLSVSMYGEHRIDVIARKFHPIIIIFSSGLPLFLLLISLLRKKSGEEEK